MPPIHHTFQMTTRPVLLPDIDSALNNDFSSTKGHHGIIDSSGLLLLQCRRSALIVHENRVGCEAGTCHIWEGSSVLSVISVKKHFHVIHDKIGFDGAEYFMSQHMPFSGISESLIPTFGK